jgi:inosine-uridine nucleoside N-ribohydrolase
MGPAGTDTNSILLFLQSPKVEVLGITVVMGDGWRDEEVAHTLRLLELVGRTDVPVVPGIDRPFIRTPESTHLWEQMYGKVLYQGAWTSPRSKHPPSVVPPLIEGEPTTKPLNESAAQFMIRMVHKYPHQVAIYAGGPMMNIATAIIEDPDFVDLASELIVMGGSISPQTDNPEYIDSQRREFNFWIDPEAASIVFHAPWHKVTVTTVDVSVQTHMTNDMLDELSKSQSPAAQYIARYARRPKQGSAGGYLWDELAVAAWIDPTLITSGRNIYMDVSLDKGISYGDTEIWSESDKSGNTLPMTFTQMNVDWPKFQRMFMQMMESPTPGANDPQILRIPPQTGTTAMPNK